MHTARPLITRAGSSFRAIVPIVVDVHAVDDPLPRFALPGEASDIDRTWRHHNDDVDRTWKREVAEEITDAMIEEIVEPVQVSTFQRAVPRPSPRPISSPPPALTVDIAEVDRSLELLETRLGEGGRRASPAKLAAIAFGSVIAIGLGVGLALRSGDSPLTASNASMSMMHVRIPIISEIDPAPPAGVAATTATMAAPVAPVPTTGMVLTPKATSGFRLFIDGSLVGVAGKAVTSRCGKHVVQIGTKGSPQKIEIPCGGSVNVVAK